MSNYSIDMLKKAAFVDELNNYLNVVDPTKYEKLVTPQLEMLVVHNLLRDYLSSRIKELDNKHK